MRARLSDFSPLVGSSGLEPPTSRLSGARSNHLSYEPVSLSAASVFFGFLFLCPFYGLGGDDGIRTHDPLLAGQVLSQLSYTPARDSLESPSRGVGTVLFSQAVSSLVSSALRSLTSVFGMGTGGPCALLAPTSFLIGH